MVLVCSWCLVSLLAIWLIVIASSNSLAHLNISGLHVIHLSNWEWSSKRAWMLNGIELSIYVDFKKFSKLNSFHLAPAQNIQFSIKDFFSKCDQISRKLQIWSTLLKISLMDNFIFCASMSKKWTGTILKRCRWSSKEF